MYRLTVSGIELSDTEFEKARVYCFRYRTGQVTGPRFETLMRGIGFTKARAHEICFDIWEGNYQYVPEVEEIRWLKVMISVSLVTTSTQSPSSERYFEVRLYVPIPYWLYDQVRGSVYDVTLPCKYVEELSQLYMACVGIYMDSKGYDQEMVETASKSYAGIMIVGEFDDDINRENKFYFEIWDAGSAVRTPPQSQKRLDFDGEVRMGMRRFRDYFNQYSMYWDKVKDACEYIRSQAGWGVRIPKDEGVKW